jgi:hypothetical protein
MADWDLPVTTSLYTVVLSQLNDRLDDAATMFNGSVSTNIPTGTFRINGASSNLLQSWNGASWVSENLSIAGTLTADVTGNADTATALATPRTISVSGDITATPVAFDGTAPISIVAAVNNDSHSHTSGTIGTLNQNTTGNAATATTATTATTVTAASQPAITTVGASLISGTKSVQTKEAIPANSVRAGTTYYYKAAGSLGGVSFHSAGSLDTWYKVQNGTGIWTAFPALPSNATVALMRAHVQHAPNTLSGGSIFRLYSSLGNIVDPSQQAWLEHMNTSFDPNETSASSWSNNSHFHIPLDSSGDIWLKWTGTGTGTWFTTMYIVGYMTD